MKFSCYVFPGVGGLHWCIPRALRPGTMPCDPGSLHSILSSALTQPWNSGCGCVCLSVASLHVSLALHVLWKQVMAAATFAARQTTGSCPFHIQLSFPCYTRHLLLHPDAVIVERLHKTELVQLVRRIRHHGMWAGLCSGAICAASGTEIRAQGDAGMHVCVALIATWVGPVGVYRWLVTRMVCACRCASGKRVRSVGSVVSRDIANPRQCVQQSE